MHGALKLIVDFALPPRCPGCGAVTQDPHRFCLDLLAAIALPDRSLLRALRPAVRS